MNDYTKSLDIFKDIDNIVENLDKFPAAVEKSRVKAKAELSQIETLEKRLAKNKEDIDKFDKIRTKEAEDTVKALQKQNEEIEKNLELVKKSTKSESALDKIKSGWDRAGKDMSLESLAGSFRNIIISGLDKLKGILEDAWGELDNILSYSRLSNSKTRDTMMTYGFSSAQAYGYDQAMEMLGFNSEEDLWYASDQEKAQFSRLMTKYTEYYTELYDSGFFEEYLDYEIEMQEFMQDVKLELVQFFMDNKDTIMTAMKALITLSEYAIQALAGIISFLDQSGSSESEKAQRYSDTISNYSTSNSSVTTNNNSFSFNNTNNGNTSSFLNTAWETIKGWLS